MVWSAPATWTVGQVVTAANLNTHLRDNLLETAPAKVTTDGDIVVATGANALERVAAMTATNLMKHEVGGLEADVNAGDGFVEIKAGATTVRKSNLAASAAPAVTDDSNAGYSVGSIWIDTTGDKVYGCVDASVGAAVWKDLSASLPAATQAEMEAGSSLTVAATPGRAQLHPSACKAWVVWAQTSGTPTINTSYNVTSLTDNAVGDLTVNFTTAFSTANYTMAPGCAEMGFVRLQTLANRAAGSCRLRVLNSSFAAADGIEGTSAEFFGDQ